MNLNEAVSKTKKVTDVMPPPKWKAHQRFLDLIEETGELANAIQVKEGYKTQARKKADLVDSICDVLFSVFSIAAIYKLDLDKEYPQVLKDIDNRRKRGEFDQI